MPFQVSLCAAVNQILAVGISLRPDVTSPCLVSLDLIATVTSGRIEGHTLLWELHSGSQVVFTTPVNQLTATCALLDSYDKVFYFWVDKGTSKERYYVFNYFGAPTDKMLNQCGNLLTTSGLNINNGSPACNTIVGTQAIFNSTSTGQGIINPNNIILVWQLPPTLTGLQSIHVEQNINGIWTNILNLIPTDTQILPNASNNTYYRIKTVYLIDYQYYDQYSCIYYLLIDIANYNIYVDDTVRLSNCNILYNPSVVYYKLLTTDSVTNELLDVLNINGINTIAQINITLYTLLNTDSVTNELLDVLNIYGTNHLNITNVTYYGGIVIGG